MNRMTRKIISFALVLMLAISMPPASALATDSNASVKSVSVSTKVVRDGKVSNEVSVSGKNHSYFIKNNEVVLHGRPLVESDMS